MAFEEPIIGASGAVAAGYTIDQSIRFNYADAPVYLEKTPGGAGTSDKKMTLNVWIKFDNDTSRASSASYIISAGSGYDFLKWGDTPNGHMRVQFNNASSGAYTTAQHFRDPSAWGMLTFAVDTANAAAGNRIRLYWNGVEITAFSTETDAALNYGMFFNAASLHVIGNTSAHEAGRQFHGYMAEFVYIDGQQLDPTSFGESDDNGNWVPIDPSGLTFGTNGFWLDFAVAPGTSNGAGTDVSGNGNHFSETGLAANDQTLDSPSDDADNNVGNYATMNPLLPARGDGSSDGNLKIVKGASTSGDNNAHSTISELTSGKWYWEMTVVASGSGSQPEMGVWSSGAGADRFDASLSGGSGEFRGWSLARSGTFAYGDTSVSSTTEEGFSVGGVVMCALDLDNNKIWFGEDGTWFDSGDPAAGSGFWTGGDGLGAPTYSYTPYAGTYNATSLTNFGQLGFAHTPPVGFKRIMTANLPAPAIKDPSKFFQVDTFTGTGSELARTLTDADGGAVKPDFVWIKDRDSAVEHVLTDSARGATKEINSDSAVVEATVAQGLKSFDTSGYTLGTDGNYNTSSSPNVAWCWVTQGGAGSSNEDGSINTTTTSVNTTAKFSVSTYTGTGSAATVGHGLGVAPDFMLHKPVDAAEQWSVYHSAMDASDPEDYAMILNTNQARANNATFYNDTAPTSSVYSIGAANETNMNTKEIVAYCWAGVEGYSKFGGYVGNGGADGPFVWLGFRPALIITKRRDGGGNWLISDLLREGYNPNNDGIFADTTAAEQTTDFLDILSNGFKPRAGDGEVNAAGAMIFAAWAAFPFGGDGVSQARAR